MRGRGRRAALSAFPPEIRDKNQPAANHWNKTGYCTNVQMNPRRTACLPASRLGCGGGCVLLVLRVEEYSSSGHTDIAVELSNPIPLFAPSRQVSFKPLSHVPSSCHCCREQDISVKLHQVFGPAADSSVLLVQVVHLGEAPPLHEQEKRILDTPGVRERGQGRGRREATCRSTVSG